MEFLSVRSYIKRLCKSGDRKSHIVRMLNQEKRKCRDKHKFGLRVNYFIRSGF